MGVGGKTYHLGRYKQESSATAAVTAAREALARGEQMDEYVAQKWPKRKAAERQSSAAGVKEAAVRLQACWKENFQKNQQSVESTPVESWRAVSKNKTVIFVFETFRFRTMYGILTENIGIFVFTENCSV